MTKVKTFVPQESLNCEPLTKPTRLLWLIKGYVSNLYVRGLKIKPDVTKIYDS